MSQSETILFFAIVLLSLILFNTHHTSTAIISYLPSSTDISFSDNGLKTFSTLIVLAIILGYLATRSWMSIIGGILLLIGVTSFANPASHFLFEINKFQYNNVKITVSGRSDLIGILPNYINANCEMTLENYKSFIALSEASNASQIIKKMPHKPIDQVKTLCAHKIFKI